MSLSDNPVLQEQAIDRLLLELSKDVEAMETPMRLAAASAMITVAGNVLRRHIRPEHRADCLAHCKQLLDAAFGKAE